jgi:dynein heavy chain 1, cytosolic
LTKGKPELLQASFEWQIHIGDLGTIPNHWRRYKVPKAMAVSGWVANFQRRLAQLDSIGQMDNLNDVEVWLGGLFFPEAYVTATRQAVAHKKKWSLETLSLRLDIERVNDPGAFIVDGKS